MSDIMHYHPNEISKIQENLNKTLNNEGKIISLKGSDSSAKSKIFSYFQKTTSAQWYCIRARCVPHTPYFLIKKLIISLQDFNKEIPEVIHEEWMKTIILNETTNTPEDPFNSNKLYRIQDECAKYLLAKIQELTSKKPLLVLLEDFDRTDYASLCIVRLVIKELQKYRIGCIFSFHEDTVPYNMILNSILASDVHAAVILPDLTLDDIGKIFEHYLPSMAVGKIFSITKGSPFYVDQLTKMLNSMPDSISTDRIPPAVGKLVHFNMQQLSDNQKEFIRYLAVSSFEFTSDFIAALLLKITPQEIADLERKEWIHVSNGGYYIGCSQLQSEICGLIPEKEKKEIHKTISEILYAQGKGDEIGYYDIAYHYHNAGETENAIKNYFTAGVQALKKSALKEAVDIFKYILSLIEFSEFPEKKGIYIYIIEMLVKLSLYVDPLSCIDVCKKYQRLIEELHKDKESFKKLFLSPFAALSQKFLKDGDNAKTDIDHIMNFDGNEEQKILFSQLQLIKALLSVKKPEECDTVIKEIEDIVKNHKVLSYFVNGLKQQKEIYSGNVNEARKNLQKVIQELEKLNTRETKEVSWILGYMYWVYETSFSVYGLKNPQDSFEKAEQLCKKYNFFELIFLLRSSKAEKKCIDGRIREFEQLISQLYELLRSIQYPPFLGIYITRLLMMELYQIGEFSLCDQWAQWLAEAASQYEHIPLHIEAGIYSVLAQYEIGNKDACLSKIEEVLEESKKHNNSQIISVLLTKAQVYLQDNKPEQAEPLLQDCRQKIENADFTGSLWETRYYMLNAWCQVLMKKHTDALPLLQKALHCAKESGNILEEGKIHVLFGRYYHEVQDEKNSILSFESANAKFIIIDNHWWLAHAARIKDSLKKISCSPTTELPLNHSKTAGSSKHSEKIDALFEFSKMIVGTLDLNVILQNALEQSMSLIKAKQGFLILVNDAGNPKVEVSRTYQDGVFIEGPSLNATSSSIVAEALKTGEPIYIQDAQDNAFFKNAESVKNLELRTIICMPLKAENQIIGLIYVDRPSISNPFTQEEKDLLQSLAGYASVGLINARLHRQIKERAEKLQMLNELSRSISSSTFLYSVIKQVLNYCLTVTNAERGYVFLGQELEFKGGLTNNGQELSKAEDARQVSKTIIRKVLLSGKSLMLSDVSDEKELAASASIANFNIQSVMCVPMIVNNQMIGVVYVASNQINKQFNEKNLSILESIVSQASLAVENAQLLENQRKYINDLEKAMKMYQRAQEKANTDLLTGLCNHGYFMDQLNRELIVAKRYGHTFSVIFIDIDLFKEINDTYGHQAGDKILKDVAEVIKSECRQSDLGARYGGDEMAIILPNTDADRAFLIAERLRTKINSLIIIEKPEKKIVHSSIGVAEISSQDNTTADLLARVDNALYTAKENGRNRVCRWGDAKEVTVEQIKNKIQFNNDEVSDIVSILGAVTSLKDQNTAWHSLEMGDLAVDIGKEFKLSREQIEGIKMAAVLHDIGKISIPDSILKKEGKLTEEEWKIVRAHTKFGRDIVMKSKNLQNLSQAVYYHHERWDGTGYPEGLKGEQIPLLARIIAVLDAFEAMICDRPYRKALTVDEAIKELEKGAGTQFDPKLVKTILKHSHLLKNNKK